MISASTAPAQSIGDELLDDMRGWRRHLHAHPELGFQEQQTTAFIRSLLGEWGLPYSAPLPTATVAHVRGALPGPVLVIRADIDALPIQEENPVSYVSTRPGVMHACGHDGHTAILLGLAKLLARRQGQLRGEIRLLFQPAEEPVPSGAPKVIEAGVLDGAMAVVGLHLRSSLSTGFIGLAAGPVMASDDRFDITITGEGGHAGYPHETTDALVVAAGLVSQLQTLVSRRVDPLAPAVVTVGSLHAGDVYNVIASEARMSGTVRALSSETRELLQTELISLADAFAGAHHAKAEVTYLRSSPPLINHAGVVDFVREAADKTVGPGRVVPPAPRMGAEDFAFYSELLPSAYATIGAGNELSFPHHHPRFDFDEQALVVGLRFLQHIAEQWTDPETPAPKFQLRP